MLNNVLEICSINKTAAMKGILISEIKRLFDGLDVLVPKSTLWAFEALVGRSKIDVGSNSMQRFLEIVEMIKVMLSA